MQARVVKSGICVLAWLCALALAIVWTNASPNHLFVMVALFVIVKLVVLGLLGCFDELWTHTSLEDLVVLSIGVAASSLVLICVLGTAPMLGPPKVAF